MRIDANMNAIKHISILTHQSQGLSIQVKGTVIIAIVKGQLISFEQTNALVVAGSINALSQLDVFLLVFDCVQQFLVGVNGRPFRRICRHAHGGHEGEQHHQRQKQTGNSFSHVFSSSFIERLVDLPRFCPRPAAAG